MVWSTDVNPNDDVFSGGADEESDGEEPEQENRLENARELRQVEK
jgi:hypothetical protein